MVQLVLIIFYISFIFHHTHSLRGAYLRSYLDFLSLVFGFNIFHILLYSLKFQEHPLNFAIIVFSQTLNLTSEQVDFLVFLLLSLNKNNAVVETFLHQVNFEVLPQNFDFTSQVIIGTLNKLKFALIFMLLNILAQKFTTAFIFTFYDFKQTPVVVLT